MAHLTQHIKDDIKKWQIHENFIEHFNMPAQFMIPDSVTNAYYTYEKVVEITESILQHVKFKPKVAIICGTGMGEITQILEDQHSITYSDIPEFPRSTVLGHKGNLVFGHLNGVAVVAMQGRFHSFEGYSQSLCSLPIKIFKLLGCKLVILTNASGALNKHYNVGDFMLVKDHFSLPLLSLQHPCKLLKFFNGKMKITTHK